MRVSYCIDCKTIYYCTTKNPPKNCPKCRKKTTEYNITFNPSRTTRDHIYFNLPNLDDNQTKCEHCHNNVFMDKLCYFHYLNQLHNKDYYFYCIMIYDNYFIKELYIEFLNDFYEKTEKGKIDYCCFVCNNKHFTNLKEAFFHNLTCKGTQKIYRNYLNLENKDYRMIETKKLLGLVAYFKFPGFEYSFSNLFIKNVISYLMGDQDRSIISIIEKDLDANYPNIGLISDNRDFFKKLAKTTQICKKCDKFYYDKDKHKNYECLKSCPCCKKQFIGLEDFNLHKSYGAQQCKYCNQTFWCNYISKHSNNFCTMSCKFCNEGFIGKINLNFHKKYKCTKILCNKCHFKGIDHICDNNGWPLLHQLCIEIK